MGVLGLLVLPTNMFVGKLSRQFEDRQLLLVFEIAACASVFLMIETHLVGYSVVQYTIGATALFVSLQAMEGRLPLGFCGCGEADV